ncbi:DUF1746 domain-containing protein [Favolaschia claudopus]|uniref:DUF1746 domain-containing protein n=1 Tax=Favolaschia claudopus TaxID=2862362 RepID=A0AAW0DYA2_9AGAR
MHKRLHAQRTHIIQSLDTLLYQLHVLAFFISPSIWTLVARLLSQSQCSKPRGPDSPWSLRAVFALVVLVNILTVWSHATSGAMDGKSVILDFIGMAVPPSKFRLLCLDLSIVFLQMLLAALSLETSLSKDSDNAGVLASATIPSSTSTVMDHSKPYPPISTPPYILDLRFQVLIARLRNPPPSAPPAAAAGNRSLDGLPLPNTTPWPLPSAGLRMMLGIPSRRAGTEGNGNNVQEPNPRRIPGALEG